MPTLTRAGATIAYDDTGAPPDRPDAPTVVLAHGLLFSGWMFHHQVDALRSRYRCVTIDWRGQGASPPSPGGRADYDLDVLCDDAASLVTHLGQGAVHWVGLSMGGMVGMRLAARRPELVRSLVLLDTSADPETWRARVEDTGLALVFRLAGIRPVQRQVEKVMFGPEFLASPDKDAVVADWLATLSRSDRAGIAHAVWGVITRRSVRPELGDVRCPTLVATGDHDVPTPPQRGRRIATAIADARFELIAGSGHSSTIEQPAAVTRLLEDFLAQH